MGKGISLNIISVLIMSLAPIINKFALGHVNPVQAALLSSIFALVFCYLYARIIGESITIIKNKYIWLIGLFNALGVICLYSSLNMLSPISVGFIGRFYIVFALLLSVVMLKEKFGRREFYLIILAIVGTFLFVEKDSNYSSLLGIGLALCYTFFFALTNTLVKITIKNVSSNTVLFYNNGISIIFIFVFAMISGESLSISNINYQGITLILLSAFLSGFLGLLLFYEGLRHIDFSLANLIRSLGPIIVAIYSWPFFPIDINVYNITGATFLLISVILLSRKSNTSKLRN